MPEGFTFTFTNRGIPMPYEAVGIWLIDQWRQVGLNATMVTIEASQHVTELRAGNFSVSRTLSAATRWSRTSISPSSSRRRSATTTTAATPTRSLDDLYQKQSRALDPEERKRYVLREFERRLLDEEVHTF